jgi:pyruvate dehydrogenase E1 component alpha subunit
MGSKIPAEVLLEMYRKMLLIRRFEERAIELYSEGLIPGLLHTYVGEEAVAVGVCQNLRNTDYITSTHRGHGHCIAKGADPKRMMAELMGKKTGYCKGKGGSMHIADFSKGILGAEAIVGAGLPIAVGAGLSLKMDKKDSVVVAFFGDGASNQGNFHECLNLASVWNLPVIFVCENNHYAISVSTKKSTSVEKISQRACAYDIPGITVDGNDVIEVYLKSRELIDRARNGEGPAILECVTYRFRGHHERDPLKYRKNEEVQEWLKRCPINRLKNHILSNKLADEEVFGEIEGDIKNTIDEAVKFAVDSPEPEFDVVFEDVYC